jgi:hypothetical protein
MHKEQLACLPYAFSGGGPTRITFETQKSSLLEIDAVFDTIAQACPSH